MTATPACQCSTGSAAVAAASSSTAAEGGDAPAAPLPEEVVAALNELRRRLHDTALRDEERAAHCKGGLDVLLSMDPAQLAAGCALLELDGAPEESVLCICQATGRPECGARSAEVLATCVLLPRVLRLEQPASRSLFSACLALCGQHARALVQAR